MNFHICAIYGSCLGILAALIFSYLNNYLLPISTFRLLNKPSDHTDENKMSNSERMASSVWCTKRFDGSKICNFQNLYYMPDLKDHLLFFMNEFSVVSGVENLKQLSLSTVQNHSGMYLKLAVIKSCELLLQQNFSYLETDTFLIKRFKPDNIMHVIHDDLIPLFLTYKQLCSGDIFACLSRHRLLFIDNNIDGPYFEWYMHFSVLEPIVIVKEKYPLWIKKGLFGLSNSSIWFQYGFKNVQGPVLNQHFNSLMLEEFAKFIRRQFGLVTEEVSAKKLKTAVLFSRKLNRKILNEGVMEEKMQYIAQTVQKTKIKIITLDLSTNNSNSIIKSLQGSQLLVGIHGSAMILAIFMHPGSHIIELFPFGIKPEFVSPLRALCKLHTIYHYESWVNMNESNTRTHPEYHPLLGGLDHLKDAEREAIMNIRTVPAVECCHDPVYLFRMFQDTVVDESFFNLFHRFISNYTSLNEQDIIAKRKELVIGKWYFPPPVFNLNCQCFDGVFKLTWDYPFLSEGLEFSLATSNGILVVTKLTHYSVETSECDVKGNNSDNLSFAVWVKVVEGNKESLDSFLNCITSDSVLGNETLI